MLSVERLQRIKDFLMEYKQADVGTLSAMLSVSEPTIRKDLEKLESNGIIKRVYGGAMLNEREPAASPLYSVEDENDTYLLEKRSIAETAAKLILDQEVVFLGHGVICTHIAKSIGDKSVTIVTNNPQILYESERNPNLEVILTGGRLVRMEPERYLSGELSRYIFDHVLINRAFFTVNGISARHGCTMQNNDLAAFYQRVMEVSASNVIVAEYSKFDKISLVPFLTIDKIETVITNETLGAEYKELLFDHGVQLFTTMSPINNINDF